MILSSAVFSCLEIKGFSNNALFRDSGASFVLESSSIPYTPWFSAIVLANKILFLELPSSLLQSMFLNEWLYRGEI